MARVSIENIKDINPTSGYLAAAVYWDPAGDYEYYGYENSEGQWYVKREDYTGADEVIIYYCKGDSDFATAWAGVDGLDYAPYDEVF